MTTHSNPEEISYSEYNRASAIDPPSVGKQGPTLPQPVDGSANLHPRHEPQIVEGHEVEQPTESHALANADHNEKGAAQMSHGHTEVRDLGWNENPIDVPNLVGGLPNEELWTLIRRFNKQMYHVKALPEPPIGGLDLNIADQEEFSPDKLRANVERLYMTVIVGVVGFGKHIARLRSWRERNRTLAFMGVYFAAWTFDLLIPTILAFVMTLIMYPQSRGYCFPPAPIALIDSKTGGIQKPAAGVLGSDDSLTGAPEKHQGEAVEQEASNFVNSFTSIALSSATGKHPQGDPHNEGQSKAESNSPDPTDIAMRAVDAKEKAAGGHPNAVHDKTKEPMGQAMWSKTRPVMHGVADVADGWERLANALSPTPPFPQERPRIILASCLAPLFLISLFTSSYMFMKANSFFAGFGFFADPIIWRGLTYLNRKYPNWQKLLEVRNTLLKGVPTNAQLAITLLRIGEANKAPLPPPPRSDVPPPVVAHATAGQDLDHLEGVSDAEMANAVQPDATALTTGAETPTPPKKKHGRRLLAFMKSTTKGGVESMLGTDRLKAAAGSEHAKNRLGAIQDGPPPESGPVDFPARYKGKKGHLYITATATSPAISWTTEKEDIDPVFSIAIADIQEIKKVGGLGWKTKLIVGWAIDREIADGILIIDKIGNQRQLTAIALREELFNRLVAIGSQMWESW